MKNGFSTPEIEQALISALMQWPKSGFPQCELNKLDEHLLTFPAHRVLFRACHTMWSNGKPIDRITLVQHLRDRKELNAVGNEYYVNETLYERCHAEEMIPYYIELLLERTARDALRETCAETLKESEAPVPVGDLIAEHEQKVASIPYSLVDEESTGSVLDRIFDQPETVTIKTKISKLDAESPLHRKNMVLIAGARKAGKTALALSIALNVAKQGVSVVYFTLEDGKEDIWQRLVSGKAGVPFAAADDLEALLSLAKARNELKALPIRVIDSLHRLNEICACIAGLCQRKEVGLVIIDYAQLIRASERTDNREQQVAEVSRTLRLLALEWSFPMLLLCQLNEDGKTRESRSLEQDCTAMWLLEKVKDKTDVLHLSVPFQRNGPSEVRFLVTFRGALSRIENYATQQ